MRNNMNMIFVIAGIATSSTAQAVSWHPTDADRGAGDFLQIALPAVGLGMTLFKGDKEGSKQWAYSMVGTALSTQVLKQAFDHTDWGERPNGGRQSFPSGHTSSACAGAVFIGRRYGWEYGAPAMLPAAFVAYSRVDEELHHWRDVIAGCAIGAAFSYYFVQPDGVSLVVIPEISSHETGVRLVLSF
jgi:membrane-associated phospholipid phosphatase